MSLTNIIVLDGDVRLKDNIVELITYLPYLIGTVIGRPIQRGNYGKHRNRRSDSGIFSGLYW